MTMGEWTQEMESDGHRLPNFVRAVQNRMLIDSIKYQRLNGDE